MTVQMAIEVTHRSLLMAVTLVAPMLITIMTVGIIFNILSTITSIKDQSITFVPKAAAAAVVVGVSMPWGIQMMTAFFTDLYQMMGQMTP